ncbi:MAG TPA: hypothetical protein VGP61_01335 [Gemmatimonadales bacterium]|nr:hypothetical protein [Gemmatimonadales bacterium]
MGPPAFMQIFREREKFGHGAAHRQTEAAWPRAFARAKIPNNYMALSTMYGSPQVWFVEGHSSIAELAAANKAIEAVPGLSAELDRYSAADAANVDNADAILARFVPEASNPTPLNLGEQHVWEITIFRVRPGKEASFFEGANLYKSVVQQAKAEAPWASYEVMAGMPGPVYLVFSPHKTLAEIDPNTGTMAAIMKAMTPETMKQLGAVSENFISVETLVLTPSPEMSYPMEEWVKQDPKFWAKKAMPAAAPAPKPAAPKP